MVELIEYRFPVKWNQQQNSVLALSMRELADGNYLCHDIMTLRQDVVVFGLFIKRDCVSVN